MSEQQRRVYARRFRRVLGFIDKHLDEELSLERLSKLAHSSPYHFHRQFSAFFGMPLHRMIRLLRLKRASLQLVFEPARRITDIALDAGFSNAESFARAFRQETGQSPSAFRSAPQWAHWQVRFAPPSTEEYHEMQVELIEFPDTPVALLAHHGPEQEVYKTTQRFIAWRQYAGLGPESGATYGIHHSDPLTTLPEDYRMDLALSVRAPAADNDFGVVNGLIPGGRCARIRHLGSRSYIAAADWLYREWLPQSGEQLRDFPMYFHYVNVGPGVREPDMITDVYLPLS